MKAAIFFVLLLGATQLNAQFFRENFNDPALPGWLGDRSLFQVVDGRLVLEDAAAGSDNLAYLSHPAITSLEEETRWEAFVRLDFAPSPRNLARVYLAASQPVLLSPLEGYFLQIGGEDGSNDALALYRQDGAETVLLLKGTPGAAADDPVIARVRVRRSAAGRWTLEADYSGGENYQFEGEVIDATYDGGRFFGFACRYSSSRADDFTFDDILVDPIIDDEQPPALLNASVAGQQELLLQFDEPLDAASVQQNSHYILDNGLGTPAAAELLSDDPTQVLLRWAQDFTDQTRYTLTVEGLNDLSGNTSDVQSIDFLYLDLARPQSGTLLLTEIMAAPSDDLGLPNAEYLEIYNAGDKALDLTNLGVASGGSPRRLPADTLLPGAYLVLTDTDHAAEVAKYAPTLGIDGFPGLTNSGDEVRITNAEGDVLVDLQYDSRWYRDPAKAGGGWSLELISLEAAVNCSGNWQASLATLGGTPGAPNSVNGQALETDGPVLVSSYTESEREVVLLFNEMLDEQQAARSENYRIEPDIRIAGAFPQQDPREVLLLLDDALMPGQIYEVFVTSGLTDCLGNEADPSVSRRVGLSQVPEPGQVIINELLYLPRVNGSDFIELFNRSEDILNLRGTVIRNLLPDGSLRSKSITRDFLVFPGDHVVVTPSLTDIVNDYEVRFPHLLLRNELPTLGESGSLSIWSPNAELLDEFHYSSELHSALLDSERGVSLERIDPEAPTNAPGNWHSAAGTVGFATPTYENSQLFSAGNTSGDQMIELVNRRFSPDGDGFEDVLQIRYRTDGPGYLAQLQVFDAQGRLVRRLLRNELLAGSGVLKWDGATPEGQKARIGIYVIWMELVHPDGRVQHWKETCVLAGQLE